MEITKLILDEFLCSLCDKLMHPPIKCCVFGHNFCIDCDQEHRGCPLCRHYKGPGRNIMLENLYDFFKFPCDYQEYGCAVVEKGAAIKEHTRNCLHAIVGCPLKVLHCPWHGRRMDVFNHALAHHSRNAMELPSPNPSLLLGSKLAPSTFVQVLVKAFSELFLFTWCLNSDCTTMRWSLMYLGSGNVEDFSFHVDFYNPPDSITVLHREAKCNTTKDITFEEFSDEKLPQMLGESDHVRYRLTVIKKNAEEVTN